jgi:ribonucleoside-triphosphate reductase (formate)
MIKEIKKRDGKIVPFDPERITRAAYKALFSVGKTDERLAQRISDRVTATLEHMFNGVSVPNVEQTQDIVESTLMNMGENEAAKAFIIYRQNHIEKRELKGDAEKIFNFARRLINDYIGGGDWRSKENSNSGAITFQGANARIAGDIWNTYALNEMYAKSNPEIKKAHETGEMHIHDLDFPNIAYCCGHSLEQLLTRGFGEVPERVQSSPAKHLRSAVSQLVNATGTFQGEFAGAQAFSSVDTFLAPFVRVDNLSYEEVKQSMQELIYGLNVPSRWGWQAPFSNLTFDLTCPEDLKNKKVLSNLKREQIEKRLEKERQEIKEKYGANFPKEEVDKYIDSRRKSLESMLNSTYGDYQKERDMINKAYLEIKLEGDKDGRIFTFPIDTYNLTKDFNWDSEVSNLLFEVTGKYGIPYFQNYIGSGLDPGAVRAMCCRLNLDQRELMKRPGGLWGPGDSTGSIGVVTINMNRIGYESKDETEFFEKLGHRMDLAKESLEIKRELVEELLERNFVPYTKSYLGHFSNHFSTIGLVGMHESLENFIGKGIETEEGRKFAEKTLYFMRDKIKEYQQKTGNLYNLEASPAEGTSYRLARLDKQIYPNIITSGTKAPYLTNSTQLPDALKIDLIESLRHQETLQPLYTGGTILHLRVGESLTGEQAKLLVRTVAEKTKLSYFSVSPVFSVCPEHNYLNGIQETCPKPGCEEKTEIYDRIVGYIRPINSYNPGKLEEFWDRKRHLAQDIIK